MRDVRHKQLRPKNRNAASVLGGGRLKLHLRLLPLNGKTWRILTLRPGYDVAFSTNYFHDTWHLISEQKGARLLARIFWGMAYQREPNTLFLLHGEHLRPTPFEAEPSLPFAICPAHLTAPDPQALRQLKRLLPRLPPPDATVRLQTWGLEETLATEDWEERRQRSGLGGGDNEHLWQRERMTLQGGLICYAALPTTLRSQADNLARMEIYRASGQGYHELAENQRPRRGGPSDGEVQIFRDYRSMLSEAEEARRDVARTDGISAANGIPREIVWDRAATISARRRARRSTALTETLQE